MIIKIATWNVNSIRKRLDQILEAFSDGVFDVLLIQETKVQDHEFPVESFKSKGLFFFFSGQKTFNGVAIISRYDLSLVLNKLPSDKEDYVFDLEPRYIECKFKVNDQYFYVASAYVYNGNDSKWINPSKEYENSEKYKVKMNFYKRLFDRKKQLNDKIAIFGGDYNVAFSEIDLFTTRGNENCPGFHQHEKDWISRYLEIGYVDSYRHFYPNKIEYSWWDYRHNKWPQNKGWRIDYMFSNLNAQKYLDSCEILKHFRGFETPSDHVPVLINLKV